MIPHVLSFSNLSAARGFVTVLFKLVKPWGKGGQMSPEKIIYDYSAPKILRLKLDGDWQITNGLPAAGKVTAQIATHTGLEQITFDVSETLKWDSGLVSFLLQLNKDCKHRHIRLALEGLPPGVQKLFILASSAMNGAGMPRKTRHKPFFEMVGSKTLRAVADMRSLFNFLGEITLAFGHLLRGKACFRRNDFFYILQRCGVDALFLVSLISVLVGMIFAFVGAIQLTMFGAQIYIAHIVGIAMVRVMAGILMAGRTGASFAAELGIMQTNEEIDALKTLGVAPVDFLVMPRILALIIMLPLLTLYADMMGILGGMVVSAGMFGINPVEYWQHTLMAVKLSNLWVGLINGLVFGVVVAIAGCYHGMQCERSAAGVGTATTSAVVSGITGIVIATAIITFICQIFGIS
jgi:phospholipid/cholesterol/gamma-HCH transport system permease protein